MNVYKREKQEWILIGNTESIEGDLSPVFQQFINVDYFFERQQPLLFELHNVDELGETISIASAQLSLGQIMGAPNLATSIDLTSGNAVFGRLNIQVESNKLANQHASFEMCWRNLNNGSSRYFGLCQTITPVFLRISRSSFEKDNNDEVIY